MHNYNIGGMYVFLIFDVLSQKTKHTLLFLIVKTLCDSCAWAEYLTSVLKMRSGLVIKMHELSRSARHMKMDSQSTTLKHTSITRSSSPAQL